MGSTVALVCCKLLVRPVQDGKIRMNIEQLIENGPLGVRLFTAGSAALYGIVSCVNVFIESTYSEEILSLYAFALSIVILITELSPLGLNILLPVFPFLGDYRGKGTLYFITGTLLLDRGMNWLARVSGVLVLLGGLLSISLHYFAPTQQSIGSNQAVFPDTYEPAEGYDQI